MKETRVFKLDTRAEVYEFCEMLKRLKKTAPKSLRCTVAVTLERATNVRETTNGNGHIEDFVLEELNLLDPPPVVKPVLRQAPRVRQIERATTRRRASPSYR